MEERKQDSQAAKQGIEQLRKGRRQLHEKVGGDIWVTKSLRKLSSKRSRERTFVSYKMQMDDYSSCC
jgi:hypothetical protein